MVNQPSRLVRWGKRIAWALLLILVLLGATVFSYRAVTLPDLNSTLVMKGLAAGVQISRDANGVPHIQAANANDAFYALGAAHAQDRLWQLTMHQRIASGRLSEILGPATLDTDKFLRTLGIRQTAQKILAKLDAKTIVSLEAYANGINATIDRIRESPWKLSPEFFIVNARPEPWTPLDSLSWLIMMSWDLSGNIQTELIRAQLIAKLPANQIELLIDGDPRFKLGDYESLYRDQGIRSFTMAMLEGLPSAAREGVGSNNWVVDGANSVSGKPLMANDPHLALSTPVLWYLAHLSAPGLEVVGASMPGVPYIVLGRNDKISWGFTNTEPDTQDLVFEQTDPNKPNQYRTPNGWAAFETRQEVIKIKGASDLVLNVRSTRNGPVISDVYTNAAIALKGVRFNPNLVMSLRWTALDGEDRSMVAGFALNTARNWQEFNVALASFGTPMQNMVYADTEGNIGFLAPGRLPIRKPSNFLYGMVPVPGWDERFDWAGFVPFDQLPRSYLPAGSGNIAGKTGGVVGSASSTDAGNIVGSSGGSYSSANQKIVTDDYPHFISSEWALPYRFDRITAMLDAQPKASIESFKAMQMDNRSGVMPKITPRLLTTRPRGSEQREILKALSTWDMTMQADSPLPLIATAWIDQLREMVFADETGRATFAMLDRRRGRHQLLARVLAPNATIVESGFCDRENTKPIESCDKIIEESFAAALLSLKQRFGDDWKQWRWGKAHAAIFEHRPFGQHALLTKIFSVGVEVGGDGYSLIATRHDPQHPSTPYATRHAASYRAIYDHSDLDRSVFMIGAGQSGHLMSPHFNDMNTRWGKGDYIEIPTARSAIKQNSVAVQILEPAKP